MLCFLGECFKNGDGKLNGKLELYGSFYKRVQPERCGSITTDFKALLCQPAVCCLRKIFLPQQNSIHAAGCNAPDAVQKVLLTEQAVCDADQLHKMLVLM